VGFDYTKGKLLIAICHMARSPLSLEGRVSEAWGKKGLAAGLSDEHVKGLPQPLIEQISRIRVKAPDVDAITAPDVAEDIIEVFIECYGKTLTDLVNESDSDPGN
jgi:hypothetical protein